MNIERTARDVIASTEFEGVAPSERAKELVREILAGRISTDDAVAEILLTRKIATDEEPAATVTVSRSAGVDGALLVMIDVPDSARPLRVLVNDDAVLADVDYENPEGEPRQAGSVEVDVYPSQVLYTETR